ncbi:MAG TPA: hypothetical protein VL404_00780 [Candidatus Eisenbacteria bacterium]|nr:hypothetical protein [Candidatus Eisenbacteria bacterium]
MKKSLFLLLALIAAFAGTAFADNINEAYNGSDTVAGTADSSETSTVDLSDKDTDQPVQSPSFENTTPAGQAPGQPINN